LHLQGASNDEIGVRLDLHLDLVRKRLERARKMLLPILPPESGLFST
jgi:DNA-directed RNA polymerase specialized sigma24 family protein